MKFSLANLFDRRSVPEHKASRTGALVALFTEGRPRWTPRDYAQLAREGYQRNPIAYRCVRTIAESVAELPVVLMQGGRELDRHPLLDLLARPNPRQTGRDLLESAAGFLLVAGNAYLELVSVAGAPRELHALRPDRIRLVPGPEGWPEAYEYSVAGRTVRFDMQTGSPSPPPILHLALFHPTDDHYGLSPLEAAAFALDVHNAAASWNKALLDNAARPSGALVYSAGGGNLSEEQFARLKQELESNYQGAANAGRPLLLEGGLDWKSLSLSPRDMDFVQAKHAAGREIALAFGVPPMLLGIPGDNTYSNYQEANRALYRQTVLPLARRLFDALAAWLAPAFGEGPAGAGPGLKLVPDLDQVSALALERESLWARVNAASFLTDDEKRAAVGYGPRGG
jgi:HK97 family phage portal protein